MTEQPYRRWLHASRGMDGVRPEQSRDRLPTARIARAVHRSSGRDARDPQTGQRRRHREPKSPPRGAASTRQACPAGEVARRTLSGSSLPLPSSPCGCLPAIRAPRSQRSLTAPYECCRLPIDGFVVLGCSLGSGVTVLLTRASMWQPEDVRSWNGFSGLHLPRDRRRR
jgi:hypothetical protein